MGNRRKSVRHQLFQQMCFYFSGLFCLGALSSCSLFGPAPKADISLVDISFADVTLFETTADVVVRIQNQNPEVLKVEGGVHYLSINSTELGSGTSQEVLEIPPFGSALQHVRLHLSNLTMLTRIRSLVDSQRFTYRIESDIPVRQGGIRRNVHIERMGTVGPEDFQAGFLGHRDDQLSMR